MFDKWFFMIKPSNNQIDNLKSLLFSLSNHWYRLWQTFAVKIRLFCVVMNREQLVINPNLKRNFSRYLKVKSSNSKPQVHRVMTCFATCFSKEKNQEKNIWFWLIIMGLLFFSDTNNHNFLQLCYQFITIFGLQENQTARIFPPSSTVVTTPIYSLLSEYLLTLIFFLGENGEIKLRILLFEILYCN